MNSSIDIEGPEPPQRTDPDDSIERTEIGAMAGARMSIGLGGQRVQLDGRYQRSLSDIGDGPGAGAVRHQGWTIMLGIAF